MTFKSSRAYMSTQTKAQCQLKAEIINLRARLAVAETERDRLREREAYFARALSVADGGQYRADWDGAISNVVRERDACRVAATEKAIQVVTLATERDQLREALHRLLDKENAE